MNEHQSPDVPCRVSGTPCGFFMPTRPAQIQAIDEMNEPAMYVVGYRPILNFKLAIERVVVVHEGLL